MDSLEFRAAFPRKCSCQEFSVEKSPRCDNCRFGICPGCSYPNEIDCRRHAPTMNTETTYDGKLRSFTGYPKVYREHWCGDYQSQNSSDETRPVADYAVGPVAQAPHSPDTRDPL